MAGIKIVLPSENCTIIPNTLLPHLKSATAAEIKTAVFMFANKTATPQEAAEKLGITPSEFESAVAFWRGAGVFTIDDSAPQKTVAAPSFSNYDSETVSRELEQNEDFASLCELCTDKLQKILTKNDYSSFFYLYDYVKLPSAVICGITEYCCKKGKKSMQYIVKTALGMYDDGIDTYDKFESEMSRREAVETEIGRLRTLCGIGGRELTPKESKLFERWFSEWRIKFELVRLAYETTVDAIGKVQFTYMDKILKSWHDNGFTSAEDVAAGVKKQGENSSFDDDEFFEAALKRGYNGKNGKGSGEDDD